MSQRGSRISLAGACVAALLAFAAFASASAQAHEWAVAGETLVGAGAKEETVSGTGGTIKLTVPGRNMYVKCSGQSTSGSIVEGGGGKGILKLTECKAFTLKGVALPCTVSSPTWEAKGELTEIKGVSYVKLTPIGTNFTTIVMTGESCPLPEEQPAAGSLGGTIEPEEKVKQLLVFSEATATATGSALKVGGSASTLEAEVTATLSGKYSGLEWGPVRTLLCSAVPTETEGTLVCPKGEAFSGKIEFNLKEGTEATFESTEGPTGTIKCSESTIEGEFTETGKGTVTSIEYHSGGGGLCTSTLSGNPKVEVEVKETPFQVKALFTQVPPPQAQLGPPIPIQFKTFRIGGSTCKYKVLPTTTTWTNGPPPGWIVKKPLELVEGVVPPCPATMVEESFMEPVPAVRIARR